MIIRSDRSFKRRCSHKTHCQSNYFNKVSKRKYPTTLNFLETNAMKQQKVFYVVLYKSTDITNNCWCYISSYHQQLVQRHTYRMLKICSFSSNSFSSSFTLKSRNLVLAITAYCDVSVKWEQFLYLQIIL